MSALSERWRSYLSARCAEDVEALAEAFLDDGLVGAVSEGEHCCVTGILRVHRGDHGNQFTPYLDARGVHEERNVSAPDDLESLLDSYWLAATDDGE
ncbi:MAG: hypothetical protein ABEH66_00575 [Halobacteriales archaeon]